jgi:acyl-CoA reductase-like NAD-dependent aldehyde dehydrogenase
VATQRNTEAPIQEFLLIGGRQIDSTSRLEVRNPAEPDELVGTVVRGTPDHVDQAVAAGKAIQPSWGALTFAQRASALRKALARLELDVDQRAAVFVREVARKFEAGQVWVNNRGILAINHLAPYGGVKQNGIGRKSGLEGIKEYVQSQAVTSYEQG